MRAIFIEDRSNANLNIFDSALDEEFRILMAEYELMESHVIYFSAGDAKIKEILIKKNPTYSV
jgi:hypothetical protein